MTELDYRCWDSIEDIPAEYLGEAFRIALAMPADREALEAIFDITEKAVSKGIQLQTARLIVMGLRLKFNLCAKAAEKVASKVCNASPYTVNDIVRGRKAYARAS